MAAKAKVFIVDHARDADHKVFFVDRDSQQKNQQLVSPGELVDHARDANVKVFIVDHERDATVKITRKNFPN